MLDDIEIFCMIAKNKSFSKAARALRISPAIATRRLAKLEEKLGVRLMNRTTRQVTLTEAGQLYYDDVRIIIENLEIANKNINSLKHEINGEVKIGLPVSITHLYVMPSLREFLAEYPDLKINLFNGNYLLALLEKGFDLIMHCGELPDSGFHYKKIGMWEKVICAAPEYLERQGTPSFPEELIDHNCLDHADNFNITWRFQEKGRLKDIEVKGNVSLNSSIDLCNLAVKGLGIVYLPSFTVKHKIKTGELVSILDSYRPPPLPMYLVYPSNKYMSQKVRVLIDFLTKIILREE